MKLDCSASAVAVKTKARVHPLADPPPPPLICIASTLPSNMYRSFQNQLCLGMWLVCIWWWRGDFELICSFAF